MSEQEPIEVFQVPTPTLPAAVLPDSYNAYRGQDTPLIIDNGASQLQEYVTNKTPHVVSNVVARYKDRKTNQPLLLFGDGIDADSGAKGQVRTPWEGDVLLNFDALEHALDCAFITLGIDTDTVDHPVLMTERLASPLHSRALTSELMFEQYSVPSLAFCIDALMSFYYRYQRPKVPFDVDGLAISFNTASTSIIPILNGKGILSHAKRIPWGAQQSTEYLLKLSQLKYHNFPTRVTTTQASWMLHNFCEFSPDYQATLRSLRDPNVMRAAARVVQFPFTVPVTEEKTEEELARIAERRKEQGKKLQEMAAKNRMEKVRRTRHHIDNKREWQNTLLEEGFDDDAALDETIKKLEQDLKKVRKKESEGQDEPTEEPTFTLVDVPDAELDEEGLKEKKKQKLLKAGFEARARARREKEKEREEREAEERRDEEERENDFDGWAGRLRKEQEAIMSRIKERERRKAALSDRKSAVAQARMKNIASLAADDRVSRRRGRLVQTDWAWKEDMFGADDEDWAIYRKINTAAPSSDEEDDIQQLQLVESKLLAHDPTFTTQHTCYGPGDVAGAARIHLNTERWRVCETYFAPSMAGVDAAGIGEVLQTVLARFTDAEKARLVKFRGLRERIYSALRPILPPEMELPPVETAQDAAMDAWRGMATFANTEEFKDVGVTRQQYEEWGKRADKRWWGGNWNAAQ
ncbi:chromatin remodeling complex subunit [Pisolithus tinctorius]|nr:chromatin remodeling complex subunit [Pisolithus tinctorius]